jgi:hypothetical protein
MVKFKKIITPIGEPEFLKIEENLDFRGCSLT